MNGLLRLRAPPAAALLAALFGCSSSHVPQTILAERCRAAGAATPIDLEIPAPESGALRIAIRQRGISLSAALITGTASADTVSPVARYGEMTFLLFESHPPHSYKIRILSRDSAKIIGEACISAERLGSDRTRLSAERAFAAAGRATVARQWQSAFELYLNAARSFDPIDRERSAEAHQAMALLAYLRLNRPRDAFALAERALVEFGTRADPGMRSALIQIQAPIIAESTPAKPDTRRERALQLLARSEVLAEQARYGARERARITILRGFVEYSTGDSRTAGQLFAQAVSQCSALRDGECYARARMDGALIAEEASNNAVALQGYADALRALSPAVAPELAADVWDNLGRLQGYMGLFSLGEQSQLNAIRLYAQFDDCYGVRRALSTLGSILVHVGNVDDALTYLNLATSHDCSALLSTTRERARLDFRISREAPDPAFAAQWGAHPRTQAPCRDPPDPATLSADGEAAVFRALLATSYGATLEADPEDARRCLAAAMAYANAPRRQLRLANTMGAAYLEGAQPTRARESFMRALSIADAAALPAAHENRGLAYLGLARASLLTQQRDEAIRHSTRALHLATARADVGQVVAALQVLALSLRAAGERQSAEHTLRTAVHLIEQVPIDELDSETRATYLATQHGVFEEWTDLLVGDALAGVSERSAGERVWAALAAAERGRARSLQYALSQAANNDPSFAHSAAQYQGLVSRIAAVAAPINASADWSAALAQLETLFPAVEERIGTLTAEELLPELSRLDATLVEFATGPDDMFAFVVDAGGIDVVPLGSRKRISAAAAALDAGLRNPERADQDVRRAAAALAQLVLWPVTAHVTKRRVIFIPDDSLHTVPFAVLPWSQDPSGPLVVQHGETSVVPSALFMLHRPARPFARHEAPGFELIGDPIFQAAAWRRDCLARDAAPSVPRLDAASAAADWTEALPRLPGSRAEVLAIAQLARSAWPASQIGMRLGCEATPAALRASVGGGADLLHIATHGYVDSLRPRLWALALSRESATSAKDTFGPLDVLEARSSARLVVLSACDTSRGRLLPGEGVLGPAQAFLQSGAAAVLATYWRVGDAATLAFMRTFYNYLLSDRLPVATALRRAQLEHSARDSAHDWAGFALFGWPDGTL